MPERIIGKVVHFFDHAMAAVIRLEADLAIGDRIRFQHNEHEFEQTVDSMQIEHQPVSSAQAGQEVAVRTREHTHEHALVYKLD